MSKTAEEFFEKNSKVVTHCEDTENEWEERVLTKGGFLLFAAQQPVNGCRWVDVKSEKDLPEGGKKYPIKYQYTAQPIQYIIGGRGLLKDYLHSIIARELKIWYLPDESIPALSQEQVREIQLKAANDAWEAAMGKFGDYESMREFKEEYLSTLNLSK